MSNRESELKAYDELTDALDDLLDGRDVDTIIPALTFTLGTILAETGQDRTMSIKFICNSIIKIYEAVEDMENEDDDHAN